jgi:hypothetical protein
VTVAAGVALLACAPAAAHAADRWFAVPLSVPTDGSPDAAAAAWVGAGGSSIYFATTSALAPEDSDTAVDVYRRDGAAVTLASGTGAGQLQPASAVSRDGSTLVFQTRDTLTSDDQDEDGTDLYATTDGVTRLVSESQPGAPFSFFTLFSGAVLMSDDGRLVAFQTNEGLVPGDTDNRFDVYLWDRATGDSTPVSAAPSGGQDVQLAFGGMANDGSHVFLDTRASLTGTDGDGEQDVYDYDTATGTLTLATPGTAQTLTFRGISADGAHVFYETNESLHTDDSDGGEGDVYQYAAGTTTLLSTAAGATPGAYDADFQKASADGSTAYFTTAEKLDPADTDANVDDIYKRTADGTVSLVSTGPAETLVHLSAIFSDISADGEHAFFYTRQDLTSDDDDATASDAFVRSGGATTRISVGEQNDQTGDDASFAGFSADASRLFFVSRAQLTSADGDARDDVYSRHDGATALVTPTADQPCTLQPSFRCDLVWRGASGDGRRVRFDADEDLSPLDGDGGATDVYESRLAIPSTVVPTAAPLTVERGAAAVPLDPDVDVTDPYDDIFSATVRIEGGAIGFTDRPGIGGTLDAAGHTLTLAGRASAADYEAALRSVTYRGDTPGTRSAEYSVDNGSGPSVPAYRTVDVPGPPADTGPGEAIGVPVTDPLVRLRIADSGGRVARLRPGGAFRVPGLHFGCPRAAPAGCVAAATIWRLGNDSQPLRPLAAGRVAIEPGGRADALVVQLGPRAVRLLGRRGRLRLLADVRFTAAGARPAAFVTRFRVVAPRR